MLAGAADLKCDVDLDVVSDFEHETGLSVGLEAGGADPEGVGTDGNVREAVKPGGVGYSGAADVGADVGEGDGGVGNRGACLIGNGTLNAGAAPCLSPGLREKDERKES